MFRIRIHLIRIRIQGFDDQNLKKKFPADKKKLFLVWWKTTINLTLSLTLGRPSYTRSLQLLKENIQHFKKRNLLIFFLLLGVIFVLLDPDPDSEHGSVSTNLIESSSIRIRNTDLDPEFWLTRSRLMHTIPLTLWKSYGLESGIALLKKYIFPVLGSMTFWCGPGSGSPDPYLLTNGSGSDSFLHWF